jgi:hypothetical protein
VSSQTRWKGREKETNTKRKQQQKRIPKWFRGVFFYILNKTMETTRGREKTTGSFKSFSILFWWGVENSTVSLKGGNNNNHNVTSKLFPRWQKMNKKRDRINPPEITGNQNVI